MTFAAIPSLTPEVRALDSGRSLPGCGAIAASLALP